MRVVCLIVSAIVAFSGATAALQDSKKSDPKNNGPSYEDTVHYIQDRMEGLEQTGQCSFAYHGYGDNWKFSFADLSPHISWSDRSPNGAFGRINCAGASKCVHLRNDRVGDQWTFEIEGNTDKSKLEKALLHLLDLCGVRPAKLDLF